MTVKTNKQMAAVLTLLALCFAGCIKPITERYPADTGENLTVTNIVGGVTNIFPLQLGPVQGGAR